MDKPQGLDLSEEALGRPGRDLLKKIRVDDTSPLPPVICIPGIGGSQLNAIVSRTDGPWYCRNTAEWYLIWLALGQLIPGPAIECWSNNFRLYYNGTTGTFSNATGVDIQVPFFGSTAGFEYLDPDVPSQTAYFISLVTSLVHFGYTKGVNLLGLPYDWRLTPDRLGFPATVQNMVEQAYESNNQSKVAIICHSMGNLFFLTFLRTVSQEWKDKYLLTYISASPPWVGAGVAVQALTSGYDFSIPYLGALAAKQLQQTLASTYFLLPNPKFYQGLVFVTTPSNNYSALNYDKMFQDLGISQMYDVWKQTLSLANPYEPPGVDMYCLYGFNVSTFSSEAYSSDDMSKAPAKIFYGNGDGTVPFDSLTFCQNWQGITSKSVTIKGYRGLEHVSLLQDASFIQDVITAIYKAGSN